MNETAISEVSPAQAVLQDAIADDRPLVAILGQSLGLSLGETDSMCSVALARLGIEGSSWSDIFSSGPLGPEFYQWLNERFERRSPSSELVSVADMHFSAVFTSSFDPVLKNLFQTDGRQPDPVVVGNPLPPVSRSKLRPRIFYLFGMTGAGQFEPPISRLELSVRQTKHATPMLNMLLDVATPLGVVVVDSIRANSDWLEPRSILGQLIDAPKESVLWFGPDPGFKGTDAELFAKLIEMNVVLRDDRSLGAVAAETQAAQGAVKLQTWNEPGIVTFEDGARLITTPSIRLSTEGSASIIDDAWMDFLPPLDETKEAVSFTLFHSIPSSTRLIFDGVRRNYTICRYFEQELTTVVRGAINNHANEKGAIVISGQSGIGKSIALYRLAASVRHEKSAAVLFARDRVPLAAELAAFLSEIDKINHVTLLIVDALVAPQRYDTLLESFRSRGHRIVIVGTSYKTDLAVQRHAGRLVEVTPNLSPGEQEALTDLTKEYSPDLILDEEFSGSEHALARFFWMLPQSRSHLASGLGREARSMERVLRDRGRSKKPVKHDATALALALVKAGYRMEAPILAQEPVVDEQNDAAGKLIDYVMACSRIHRWVPINLLLRAVVSENLTSQHGLDLELIRDLFDGNDLFRWRYHDNREDQLLVGARLQLEAQLICDQRLRGPGHEVERIIELISNATRAGPDGAGETYFVAEIVYALGPYGPLGGRYQESYGKIAEALTRLRKECDVRNARLMLQEATLRRRFIRWNDSEMSEEEVSRILDEAREAVEEALSNIGSPDSDLHAGRRTIENLWVERAATYGFLATSAARRGKMADVIWGNYLAARQASQKATGRVDTYHPLDISLWTPIELLEAEMPLGIEQDVELRADIMSTIDMVNEDDLDLDANNAEMFHKQQLRAADLLKDSDLSDEAFAALDKIGSSVGYYFRAKKLAPEWTAIDTTGTSSQFEQAKAASEYLLQNRDRVSDDPRCMRLLLSCLWLWKTESWLLRRLRQPLPSSDADRSLILEVLRDLSSGSGTDLPPKFKYLIAVLRWLNGNESDAIRQFRQLARDTEYVEGKRVLLRNVITNANKEPVKFSGVVERQISDRRWSVHVRGLNRKVDLLEDRWIKDVSIGKELRSFSIAFNYLGPIVDWPQ